MQNLTVNFCSLSLTLFQSNTAFAFADTTAAIVWFRTVCFVCRSLANHRFIHSEICDWLFATTEYFLSQFRLYSVNSNAFEIIHNAVYGYCVTTARQSRYNVKLSEYFVHCSRWFPFTHSISLNPCMCSISFSTHGLSEFSSYSRLSNVLSTFIRCSTVR